MIISIQGYSQKKNKAAMLTAAVASYLSMHKEERTLVIQLINPDLDSLDRIFLNMNNASHLHRDYNKEIVISIVEEGIDGLLGTIINQKITNELLSNYVRTVHSIQSKNGNIVKTLLDIVPISKNNNFVSNLVTKGDLIQMLITATAGENMYDNVIVLSDGSKNRLQNIINPIVDKKIVCISQDTREKILQDDSNTFYVVTEYESDSEFTLSKIRKRLSVSSNLYKVERNVRVLDAVRDGNFAAFMRNLKDISKNNDCSIWLQDIENLITALNTKYLFHKELSLPKYKRSETALHLYQEPKKKEPHIESKKGFFSQLYKITIL